MAKTYRATQQWNHWLSQFLGQNVLEMESVTLAKILPQHGRRYALLIGVPHQGNLLNVCTITYPVLVTPVMIKAKQMDTIESGLNELPIASGSIDLVLLPHTLEYLDNPRQLLSEACRIVKPEGNIIVLGFNPWSLWGLKKILSKNKFLPWIKSLILPRTVKKWLDLADFELTQQEMLLFRPPIHHHGLYRHLKFLEWLGRKLYRPLGGAYILVAKAKVISLTPIRLRWQQKISTMPAAIYKPTMRDF